MDRVKFSIPEKKLFSKEMELLVSHMNYGNHLGNDTVLTLAHEVRVSWLRSLGYGELDIEGVGVIQSDAMVKYRSEGHLGDKVNLELYLGDYNSKMINLYCKIMNIKAEQEIARIKVGLVFFDYKEKKITNMPEKFKEILEDV